MSSQVRIDAIATIAGTGDAARATRITTEQVPITIAAIKSDKAAVKMKSPAVNSRGKDSAAATVPCKAMRNGAARSQAKRDDSLTGARGDAKP